ncbi:VOC family protein [Nonomuraea sp. NPDC052265]|uniref:VOC family protein n=1 Tax=Nonomuraea sp. NPDC052265 TaxID=3364374 RepID=UPI0037CA2D6C
MTTELDTLATALYVKTDDLLKASPQLTPWRPKIGISPRLSDAELVTLAVMQALLGFTFEARWLRHAHAHLRHLFPYLPQQSGYNKRLRRAAGLIRHVVRALAMDTTLWSDDVWVIDSTPVECGRSRETANRSDLAGWAQYGYCASHSRYFWGLRLHLVCTLGGLPVAFALTGAKANEQQTPADNHSVIVEFLVDDVDRVYENLTGFVTDFVNEPTTMPWGNRSLLFRDPDGNLVNFFTPVTPAAVARSAR